MKYIRFSFMVVFYLSNTVSAMSLQEAIRFSLENNPKTVANQLRVDAMKERASAQRMDLLPSLHLGANVQYSIDNSLASSSNGIGLSTSVNIYNGGADSYAQKSLQASLKATDARYTSSNAYIPNTKGSIAKHVKDAYVSLIEVLEQKKYLDSLGATLQLFINANPTEDEKILIQQRINNLSTSLIRTESNLASALKDFKYFATVPAPEFDQLDSFEKVTQSLSIPTTVEEAFQMALIKSPDLKVAAFELEAAQYDYKSEKARLYSAKVNVNASIQRSNSAMDGSNSQLNSRSIGLSVGYILSPSSSLRDSAAAKSVQASMRDRDGAVDELKYDIESIYPALETQEKLYESQLANLKSADDSLKVIIQKIKQGQKVDLKTALSVLDSQGQYWSNCLMQQHSILDTHFNIQRSVGILFEGLRISEKSLSMIR
ncbi:MAG: TolC family protein [Pseudobdellovibrio sp.]